MERFYFSFADIPDLSGKVAVVTGANSGIGEVIARELARQHCRVYVASRSQSRAEAAIARVRAIVPDADLRFLELDLETIKGSVLAARFLLKLEDRLDIVVANAGLGAIRSQLTPDGYERNFGVNHLGHFAFVTTLLPLIRRTAESAIVRVVVVSSRSYANAGPIDYDDLTKTFVSSNHFSTLREMLGRYGRSKLCNIYFAKKLADVADNANVFVNACHPGLVPTNIFDLSTSPLPKYMQFFGTLQAHVFGINVDDGAKTALFLATSNTVPEKGIKSQMIYPGPYGFVYYRYVYVHSLNSLASDVAAREQLWQWSTERVQKAIEGVSG